MAEALYRKYRPQVFEDVVGQEPIERTLKNAISQDKVSHAYLFCGPRGTGKTTTARLLAKALLCEKGPTPDPDGTCEDCKLIADGAHPDVYELDAASRTGVENVREEIISRVHFAPTRGRYKVYIIDEVHMLSTAAFNALLKTLEEPPAHIVFILCTTDPQKVPETIHSRCQRFDFRRIVPESMVARLGAICMAEEVEFEGEALDLIAQRAEGGLRNALTSLEQIIAFDNGRVTLAGAERLLGSIDSNELAEIMSFIGRRDIARCFTWTAAYVETGADLAQFVRDMAEHVRNLYVMALVGDDAELDVPETARRELAGELEWFGPDRAARLLGVLGDLMAELKTSSNPRLAFEIALTRMVRPDSDLTIEALAERVEALESGYSAVAHVLPGPVAEAAAQENVSAGSRGEAPAERTQAPKGAQGNDAPGPLPESFAPEPERQAPAAEPSVAVPAAGSSKLASLSNPASLQRIWQAALATVKKQKQAYGVLFMNTKAVFDEASGMVCVQFSPESTFAYNAVQKPDVQDVLADALAKAVGESVQFCYTQGNAPAPVGIAPQASQVPEPEPAPAAAPASAAAPAAASSAAAPAPAPGPEPAPATPVERVPASEPASAPAAGFVEPSAPQPHPVEPPSYDPVPYDQVPYEDMPYDPVPYDDVPYDYARYGAPSASASAPAAAPAADASTAASPAGPNLTPGGAIEEDPAAVQALLQASFGAGVKFTEE